MPSSQSLSSSNSKRTTKNNRIEALHARKALLESTVAALTTERDMLVSSTLSKTGNVKIKDSSSSSSSSFSSSSCSSSSSSSTAAAAAAATTTTTNTNPDAILQSAMDLATQRLKSHIRQLQQYNEIKDVGTQLMGLIAEKRGVRVGEVHTELGLDPED